VNDAAQMIQAALKRGQKTLSEYESKLILAGYGLPVVRETLAADPAEAIKAAAGIGYPVALKFCSAEVTHKTERGLIELDLRREEELAEACQLLLERAAGAPGQFLVQEMIRGGRELVIGLSRDPQLGPAVMFGLGGIFTEILQDVSFRLAPLSREDALAMMAEIRGRKILGAVRGMPAVDLEALGQSLIALGRIGLEHEAVQEIDVNPLIVRGSQAVAVDALIVLAV